MRPLATEQVSGARPAPALGLRRGRLLSHSIADRIEKRSFTMSISDLAFGDLLRTATPGAASALTRTQRRPIAGTPSGPVWKDSRSGSR